MVELIKNTSLCACAFVYVYRHTIHLSYLAGLLFIVINFLKTSQMLLRESIPALSSSADYLLNSCIKTMFFCVMNCVEGPLQQQRALANFRWILKHIRGRVKGQGWSQGQWSDWCLKCHWSLPSTSLAETWKICNFIDWLIRPTSQLQAPLLPWTFGHRDWGISTCPPNKWHCLVGVCLNFLFDFSKTILSQVVFL